MYLGDPPSPSSFLAMCVASICCARPKSQILAFCCPSSRMFIDFKSRCTTRWECRKQMPSAMWQATIHLCMGARGGSRREPNRRSCSEPPDMNSVTTSSSGGSTQAPMKRTSRGWRSLLKALISFLTSSRCPAPVIFLIATSWPFHEPRKTSADPPAPSCGPKTSCSRRMSSFQPIVRGPPLPPLDGESSRGPMVERRPRWPSPGGPGGAPGP
mmetsp:Transcript_24980/g.78439  ORF Transcript_24980/g.78439 Transcript_24980/m.78439 type:complete len:213 (+) Transcript_24980:446-1084(+)